jgi:nucleoside-diphosphate-sugar epimerase
MSGTTAVLGASGFIGSRIVEMFHLGGLAEVRPVARSMGSLARMSRFNLDWRLADALDEEALRAAFAGCETVIHAIAGDLATIRDSVTPVYRAAGDAGVRRLVYLSSASVHGQAPHLGTDEETPVSRRQPIAYNSAKAWAERRLLGLRANGSVELVILRPGIVTGPRSIWQSRFAAELLAGNACWFDDGRAICNSLYVDNLVHAIHLALDAAGADGRAFLVGDEETITWADLTGRSPKRWVLIRCCCRTSTTCRRAAICTSSRVQSKARELAARSHGWYPRSCAAEFEPRSRRWRRTSGPPGRCRQRARRLRRP